MFDHYSNMYPQLIKEESVLNPLKMFFRYLHKQFFLKESSNLVSVKMSLIFSKQEQWSREQVKVRRNSDPLWKHLGLILAQLDGLHAGAAHWAKSNHREVCGCVLKRW